MERRLPKSIIKDIFSYFESTRLFTERLYALNRSFYQDISFVRRVFSEHLMAKLGVISDLDFEIDYFQEVIGLNLSAEHSQLGPSRLRFKYNDLPTIQEYLRFHKETQRKYSKRQLLFGYQALGGCEITDSRDPKFLKQCVTQLFVDSDGVYCSSERCDPCVVSGVFFEEPVLESEGA